VTNRIVLVRHADIDAEWSGRWVGGGTDAAADPASLADLGPRLFDHVRRDPPDRVIASPMRRARETAALLGLPIEIDPRLAERHFGEWEGRLTEDCLRNVPPEFLQGAERWLELPIPGAEPLSVVVERVAAFVADLRSDPRRATWCVAHAGTIRLIVAAVRGISPAEAFAMPVSHGAPLALDLE
jgi:alpha-ribazole phosphatase